MPQIGSKIDIGHVVKFWETCFEYGEKGSKDKSMGHVSSKMIFLFQGSREGFFVFLALPSFNFGMRKVNNLFITFPIFPARNTLRIEYVLGLTERYNIFPTSLNSKTED